MKQIIFITVLFSVLSAALSAEAADVYVSAPTFSPYYAGKVKSEVLNEALAELNYVRWLVGVPNNVILNDDYTNKAQHGAVLLDAIDTITHTPGKPSDMSEFFYKLGYEATTHGNLSFEQIQTTRYINGIKSSSKISGSMTFSKSIKSLMDDSDPRNIRNVGHRRWFMNPRLKRVGFGISTRLGYVVAYVIEEFTKKKVLNQKEYAAYQRWLKWPVNDSFISWPTSKHNHPLTYFNRETAWSVTLNHDVFEAIKNNSVNIKLTRLNDNKSWNFSKKYGSDGEFYISDNKIAYDECLIFRPNNISKYNGGEKWLVEISGLNRKSGESSKISYTVKFTDEKTGFDFDIPLPYSERYKKF